MLQTRVPGVSRVIILSVFFLLFLQPFLSAQCYELVWAEEFNYTGLPDPNIWTHEVGGGGWGNNELQYYTDRDTDNAWVEDGTLLINALKENFGGRSYTSARLVSKGKGEFKYGKIEARLKLPYGQGMWAAFWMLGTNFSDVGWPASGEIDIMEMVGGGTGDKTTHGTVHWEDNGHASYGGSKTLSSGIFADTFHVFSVEWTSQKISWLLDGVQFHVVDIRPSGLSEFHQEFFIILNLAVGGNWPGSPDGTTVFPQHFEVDYVRVYQAGESLKITGDQVAAIRQKNLNFSLPDDTSRTFDWSVPEGATITSGQGTHEIMVDWGCDPGQVTCDLTTICNTYNLDFDVALETVIKGDLFVEENQKDFLLYVAEMDNTYYHWSVLGDALITSGQGTDSILVDWGTTEGPVNLVLENECGITNLSRFLRFYGQYPYPDPEVPQQIPGTIIPTHYDFGGEGVAYHDNSLSNEGPGPRQDERVDTEYGDGSENVGWITAGEWIEYSIRVDTASSYNVEIRVATNNASGGPFNLLFNGGNRLGPVNVPGTGGWFSYITINPGIVSLTEQDTVMRFESGSGGFNLGRISFTTHTVGIEENLNEPELLNLYPNPAKHFLQVNHCSEIMGIMVTDLTGRIILQEPGTGGSTYIVDTRGFFPGTYILSLLNAKNDLSRGKFIKIW